MYVPYIYTIALLNVYSDWSKGVRTSMVRYRLFPHSVNKLKTIDTWQNHMTPLYTASCFIPYIIHHLRTLSHVTVTRKTK